MTLTQQIIIVAIAAAGTFLTRFLPFAVFPADKPTPKFIKYLGNALPAAIFGLLVIYCLKNVSIFEGNHALPELISIAVIVLIHLLKKNTLLSIAAGTVCYMLLIRFIF